MLGCKDKTYAFYLSNKGLILKRCKDRDQKDPGVQNTGAFKMNMNVKINTIWWFEECALSRWAEKELTHKMSISCILIFVLMIAQVDFLLNCMLLQILSTEHLLSLPLPVILISMERRETFHVLYIFQYL